jgi:hypothetical protein
LEILKIIEFNRDALEEEPVVQIGKRKRTSEESGVPDDVPVYVRSDSEELSARTWSSDPVYDREELARENAELKVSLSVILNPIPAHTISDSCESRICATLEKRAW